MFVMFRSQKKRQQQQQSVQTSLEAGAGVRTIGGLYAQVKAVNDETVELEIAPGVVSHFTKGAIAVVLDPQEYDAIVNGRPLEDELAEAAEAVEDEDSEEAGEKPLSLSKDDSEKDGAEGGAPASK